MDKKTDSTIFILSGVFIVILTIRNIQLMREVSKLKEEVAQLKIEPK